MRTLCVPGGRSATTIGVKPTDRPSTKTWAPVGRESTCNAAGPDGASDGAGAADADGADDRAVAPGAGGDGLGSSTAASVKFWPFVASGAGGGGAATSVVGDVSRKMKKPPPRPATTPSTMTTAPSNQPD